MNPGVSEEAGKVASGIVDALKAQPAVLALTIGNIALLIFVFYALHGAAEFRELLLKQQHEYQREVAQMLAKCVIPGPQGFRLQSDESHPVQLPPLPPPKPVDP
jgi:hypothetical protein